MGLTIVLPEEEVFALCVLKALEIVSFKVPEGKQFEADFLRSYSGTVKVTLVDIPEPVVEPTDAAVSDTVE